MFCGYLLITAVYTWPLLPQLSKQIASDPYDPILGATMLQWNATTLPFSERWWSPPFFFPHERVGAFTENFVGISAVASPVYWLTGNAIEAYNIAFFLTWPLAAFGVYLLVRHLTARTDAAIVAGAAFAFSPYRLGQLPHIIVLSLYWLPILFFSLHKFLERRRPGWLVLFGVAWILQSLSNGYAMFYGGVVIGLWILYFCSRRDTWRAGVAIVVAWILAMAPLVPVFLKYKAVHDEYGLGRSTYEVQVFSAQLWAWARVTEISWLWSKVLAPAVNEAVLFPGLTVVILVALAAWVSWRFRSPLERAPERGAIVVSRTLGILAVLTLVAGLVTLATGSWRFDVLGLRVSMSSSSRAFAIALVLAIACAAFTRRARQALASRPALTFYAGATLMTMVLAHGPVMAYRSVVILDPAPYGWLERVPGVNELRVPTRFWMVGSMCLAVAAGAAFARLVPGSARWRVIACAGALTGVLIDGWPTMFPLAAVPDRLSFVERRDRSNPIIELPLNLDVDSAAMFRTMIHGRRVVNGASGYEPPAYVILRQGIDARDPAMLRALASIGPLDVVIAKAQDPDGELARYISAADGAQLLFSNGTHTAYELPAAPWRDPVGKPWPIREGRANANFDPVPLAFDGNPATQWVTGPQDGIEWFAVDLGEERLVAGVEDYIGRDTYGFPRRLAVDLSRDGWTWRQAWDGPTAAPAFVSAVAHPREIAVRVTFDAQPARFVRLRQLGKVSGGWTIAELRVFAPADGQ